jgi:hypothetical protein
MPERGSITIWIEHRKAVEPLYAGRLKPMADDGAVLVTLHLLPLPDEIPVDIRLRALPKTALRQDRLRCVSLAQFRVVKPKPTR